MTEQFRIEVVIRPDERGARRTRRQLEGIESVADRLGATIRRALAFAGGAVAVRGVVQLADAYVNLQNRVRTVVDGNLELARTTDELFRIANDTRVVFDSTAEVYVRTAAATRDLGLSQQRTLGFIKSLNQAVVLSGAAAQESRAGLIQLSQGLAAGALRGDELRSVLEQLPAVADVIADSLGVTRGELRRLGEDGQLTARVIIQAFEEARAELEERFAQTVPTIGQSFTVLRNRVAQFVGEFDQAIGGSRFFSGLILEASENVEAFARAAVFAGTALSIDFARRGIGAAITGIRALSVALLTNPLTALPAVLGLGVAGLVAFGDEVRISSDSIATLQDLASATLGFIAEKFTELRPIVATAFSEIRKRVEDALGGVDLSIRGVLESAARVGDAAVGIFSGLVNAIFETFERGEAAAGDFFIQSINAVIRFTEDGIDLVLAAFLTVTQTSRSVGSAVVNFFRELDAALGLLLKGEVAAAVQFADEALETFGNRLRRAALDVDDVFVSKVRQLGETDLVGELANPFAGAAAQLGDAVVGGFLAGFQTTVVTDALDAIIVRAEAAAEAARVAREEEDRRRAELGGDPGGPLPTPEELSGLASGFQRIQNELLDTSGFISDSVVRAYGAAEDAVVSFVQTGQLNVSQFVDSVLADVTRLLARQGIIALINSFGASPTGPGADTSLIPGLFAGARQFGGPVRAGETVVVGERNEPELFTAETDGQITPAGRIAAALGIGAAAPVVNVTAPPVNIVNVSDPGEIPAGIESPEGQAAVMNVVSRNRRTMRSLI